MRIILFNLQIEWHNYQQQPAFEKLTMNAQYVTGHVEILAWEMIEINEKHCIMKNLITCCYQCMHFRLHLVSNSPDRKTCLEIIRNLGCGYNISQNQP